MLCQIREGALSPTEPWAHLEADVRDRGRDAKGHRKAWDDMGRCAKGSDAGGRDTTRNSVSWIPVGKNGACDRGDKGG